MKGRFRLGSVAKILVVGWAANKTKVLAKVIVKPWNLNGDVRFCYKMKDKLIICRCLTHN
jgi:hypothetical protein